MAFVGHDEEFASEILTLFRDQFRTYLESLTETKGDWRANAHQAKGAARGIGAWRLAVMGERAERMAEPPHGSIARAKIIGELDERYQELVLLLQEKKLVD